jgi:prophage DNA circulation protein
MDAYTSFSASILQGENSQHMTSRGRYSEMQLLLDIIMTIEELQSFLFALNSQLNVISQMQRAYTEIEHARKISSKALPLLVETYDDVVRVKKDVERLITNATQIQAAVND